MPISYAFCRGIFFLFFDKRKKIHPTTPKKRKKRLRATALRTRNHLVNFYEKVRSEASEYTLGVEARTQSPYQIRYFPCYQGTGARFRPPSLRKVGFADISSRIWLRANRGVTRGYPPSSFFSFFWVCKGHFFSFIEKKKKNTLT